MSESSVSETDTFCLRVSGSEKVQGDEEGDHASLSFPFDILFEWRGEIYGVVGGRDWRFQARRLETGIKSTGFETSLE